MTRVLVTGGVGFVGSHLTRSCLHEEWQVGVTYLPQEDLSQIGDVKTRISTFPVNGTTEDVLSIVERFKPDLIFHLASVFLVQHTSEQIMNLINSNITFGTQILEAMARFNVQYFINTGTSWQHYLGDNYNPVNLYAATKQAFDDILEYYIQANRIRAITLKIFDTYGPADHRPKLFSILTRAANEGSRLDMSLGEQLIDMVHIDDVVSAFLVAAKRLFNGKVSHHDRYAVSSGKPIPLRELVEIYQHVTRQDINIVWGGRPYREREVMVPWKSGKRLPGWRPKIKLEQGILNLLEENNG
jgi:nucleoside-diphosphate-sugar epimerase